MRVERIPQCMACGSVLTLGESEKPFNLKRRRHCRSESCKKILRDQGPQFPKYREKPLAQDVSIPRHRTMLSDAALFAHRVPAWLLQPVENSVQNP